jgi:hypothetical protein
MAILLGGGGKWQANISELELTTDGVQSASRERSSGSDTKRGPGAVRAPATCDKY